MGSRVRIPPLPPVGSVVLKLSYATISASTFLMKDAMSIYKEFEEWINNPHLLSKRDSPKLWRGSKEEIAKHESNPYDHPYTAGAYEAWKYLKSSERK